jgi:uncharacterized membrane protein AbrB (regulator of aidB expression)
VTTDFNWRWLDRRAFRSAGRHAMRTFDAELRSLPAGPARSVVLTVASWMLYVLIGALFGCGVWLCTLQFPGPGLIVGLIVIAYWTVR